MQQSKKEILDSRPARPPKPKPPPPPPRPKPQKESSENNKQAK